MGETRCINCMRIIPDTEDVCKYCGFSQKHYRREFYQLPVGQPLHDGRYQVGRVIGEGGFGIVYIGWDYNFSQAVAIKEFYSRQLVTRYNTIRVNLYKETPEAQNQYRTELDRVKKEARAIKQFAEYPGIVRVEDFFEENNTIYLVMAYVEGITLKHYMENKSGGMGSEECLRMFKPLVKTLFSVHERGVLHRDISLDNIMLQKDNTLKLLDFGAARPIDVKTETVTVRYGYAPKEQYDPNPKMQGPWTDVYSLCVCLWNCLTGETMPDSRDREEGDIWKNHNPVHGLTGKQKDAIRRGLELDVEKRMQSMNELYYGLYGEWLKVPKVHTGRSASKRISVTDDGEPPVPPVPWFKRKAVAAAAVVLLCAACCAGGVYYWYWDTTTPKTWTDADGNTFTCVKSGGLANGNGTCTYANGDVYTGDFADGLKSGTGTLVYAGDDAENRVQYEGEWEEDVYSGTGTLTWADGSSYEGDWENGEYSGTGTMAYAETDEEGRVSYTGEWADGVISGTGIMVWANGEIYEGEWSDGVISGTGTMTFSETDESERVSYTGEWSDGKRNGTGTMVWTDGDTYEGEWSDGKRNGTGIYTYSESDESGLLSYSGEWADSEKNGQGVYTYREDNERLLFAGTFVNGKPNGTGALIYRSGLRYEGTWTDDTLQGQVTIWYSDSDESNRLKYVGGGKDGKRDGFGRLYWKDGGVWEGDFSEDSRSGSGVYWYPEDNERLKLLATWDGDDCSGPAALYYRDGTVEVGIWNADSGSFERTVEEESWTDSAGISYTGYRLAGEIIGPVTVQYTNGDTYEGDMIASQRWGEGTYTIQDEGTYSGAYMFGSRNGYGVYTFSNGMVYSGEWSGGVMDGFGVLTNADEYVLLLAYWSEGEYQSPGIDGASSWKDADGNYYCGVKTDGFLEGTGIALLADGTRCEGEFSEGVLNGTGVCYYGEESEMLSASGTFQNGQLSGTGVLIFRDGRRSEGEFTDGVLTKGTTYHLDGTVEEIG